MLFANFAFVSCEKFIDYDVPEHEPRLVVISGFQPAEPWSVFVSHSLSSFDNDNYSQIHNADVTVNSVDGSYSEKLIYSNMSNRYYSTEIPEEGREYEILVSTSRYPTASSTNKIPEAATILSLDTVEGYHNGDFTLDFELTFSNSSAEENFFIVQLYTIESYSWKDEFQNLIYIQSDDPNVEQVGEDDYGDDMLFLKDQSFDGREYTLRFYTPEYFSPNYGKSAQFRVKVLTSSEEFYRYQKSSKQYNYSNDNPFAQPVQIYSNIENGIGVFGGYSVSEIDL
ncbi:DUF4249 domain-containing protein [Candidatus Venteria ishoeyi]|uniref:DUF4249 domain-containing protein n=1 Tax=Candidatus Venteria ishoeyi TaxID=1899563 RepID=UPI0015A8BB09|nr:DUF4249 domain-containing protein [Candidatus Venteria ishoeyi]